MNLLPQIQEKRLTRPLRWNLLRRAWDKITLSHVGLSTTRIAQAPPGPVPSDSEGMEPGVPPQCSQA